MSKKLVYLFTGLLVFSCTSGSYIERIPKRSESSYPYKSTIYRIDGTSSSESELSSRIQELADSAKVTGLAISIFNDNEVIYKRAFGKANSINNVELRTNHVIYGASLSKAVFGYIVANLVNEGIIDLDKPLQEYLDRRDSQYTKSVITLKNKKRLWRRLFMQYYNKQSNS